MGSKSNFIMGGVVIIFGLIFLAVCSSEAFQNFIVDTLTSGGGTTP